MVVVLGREILQGSAKRWFPGLVNFVTAVAYHFCLALPAAFTPGDHLLDVGRQRHGIMLDRNNVGC